MYAETSPYEVILISTEITRNGVKYSPTTVKIPLDLKNRAQNEGISLSGTLKEALLNKLNEKI